MSALDLFRLDGRSALITGAAGYLGRTMALTLAEAGAHVWLNGRREPRLRELADAINARGLSAEPATFDVTDGDAVGAFVSNLTSLDVLVNNANDPISGDVATSSREQFASTYDIAVTGAFGLVQSTLPLLRASTAPSVVNVGSMYGLVAPSPDVYPDVPPNPPFYGPAKAALIQLTRYLAAFLGPERIRVNALCPGTCPSDLVRQTEPAFIERLASKTMLGRIGQPEDLRGALLFLASDASAYVTGAVLSVDGGWTAW